MRLTTRQTGIISYAGLDKDALWAKAKRAFAQADEEVPGRYASFLPIFPIELVQNMSYVGASDSNHARVSPAGFSIDPTEYHQKLYEQMPELYADDNRSRNFDYEGRFKGRAVMTVDRTWATIFPQYQPFMGERLVIHMIGGGHQAVAVPESVYPRGCGILRSAEMDMRVTARCEHFTAYVRQRIASGQKYDPVLFEDDYLRINDLLPVCVKQAELGRVMQDLCIIKSLQGEQSSAGLFTENAKRAEHITQYVPFRSACDTFESAPITRATARLVQLHFEGDEFISDLWMPYQDASEYIDKQRMTLDVRSLCEGFQVAPAYDPETGGGRYPDCVRVVIVRDRDIRPMVADTLNNPAYGSGMSPLGMINKLVFLSESKELLRQRKLAPEEARLQCENTRVGTEDFRRMTALAALQEHKGKLVDAMYRRESALSQMQTGSRAYERARELLNEKVERLAAQVAHEGAAQGRGQLSGYDADIDYLRRMQQNREGVPDEEEHEPVAFAVDPLRELSIESGYAMRNSVRCFGMAELYDGAPDEEPDVPVEENAEGATESEPEAAAETQEAEAAASSEPDLADEPSENGALTEEEAVQRASEPEPEAAAETQEAEAAASSEPDLADEPSENGALTEEEAVQRASEPEPEAAAETQEAEAAASSEPDLADEPSENGALTEEEAAALDKGATGAQGTVGNRSMKQKLQSTHPKVSMTDLSRNRLSGRENAAQTINKQGKMAQLLERKKHNP